jgi:hypothetical protein
MNSNSNSKPSKAALTGMKVVLVSASIAGSIGLWGALSQEAMNVAAKSDDSASDVPGVTDLAYLPTLTNLIQIDTSKVVQYAPTPTAGPVLRDVAMMPTPTAYTAPEVKTVVIGVPVSGGGGGGKSKPGTKTKSS